MKHRLVKYFFPIVVLLSAGCGGEHEVSGGTAAPEKRFTDGELSALRVQPQAQGKRYKFGFDLRNSPQEDARQYLPFLDYLSKATGLDFELRFTPKTSGIVDDLGHGEVQFAAIGAISFIKAHNKYRVIPLVRGLNQAGRADYRSVIVTLPGSPLKSLRDLRGRRVAFGDRDSTQGHIIPRIELLKEKLRLADLASYHYTGSHKNCADAVLNREADACGMQDTLADSLIERKLLRELYRSPYYPSSGIAASADVPTEVVRKIRQALLDFNPKGEIAGRLYNWHLTEMPNGFTSAEVSDYQVLADWLTRLEQEVP